MDVGPILVADVGGTHARFGIAELRQGGHAELTHRRDLDTAQFSGFAHAFDEYTRRIGQQSLPQRACVAAAGPVSNGRVSLTNSQWSVSESELRSLGLNECLVINDFAALACSIPGLDRTAVRCIGPQLHGDETAPVSIVGAGTGFGVACLVRNAGSRGIPLVTEGGHIAFAPTDDEQLRILQQFRRQQPRVSVERILSGSGLEHLHRAREELAGVRSLSLTAAQVTAGALEGERNCLDTVNLFCAIYGAVAGDIALAHGARGGVIVAGGIAHKIEPLLFSSPFRERFEDKGRLSQYVKSIPTWLLIDPDAALRGAAAAALDAWS